ncbi:YcxB family protein [Streptomyces sp. NRRL B-24484]|uniref:YcxB family protein n=1 Tax=Streptomyces sp. NRRL B-24484 TaxID=1463833 RepID=UPI0004C1DEBD|nr:YcxB family protein [Streptomyces sp. NRRL B-24484]
MHITAEYEITPQERARAFRQGTAKQRRKAWALCALMSALGVVEVRFLRQPVYGGMSLAVGLVALGMLTVGTRTAVRDQTPPSSEPVEVTVTDTGVTLRRPGHTTETAWWAVRFVETADFFLLYHAPRLFTPVLKRGFTPEQQTEVRALAAAGRPAQPAGPSRATAVG